MPFKIQPASKGSRLFFVVNTQTGKKYSYEPLTHSMAVRQIAALHIKTGH